MTDQNVEVVRAFYAAWKRGDLPGPVELMDPQMEYVNPDGALEPGTRQGRGEVTRAMERVLEGWSTWANEPEEMIEQGDRVAVVVSYRARGRSSGIEVEGRESALWTLRDGKVVRYEWFHGPDDAQKALQTDE
jgi:ketosteroid isomerase-like protein